MLQTFYAMKKTLFFIWSPKSNGHYFFFFIGNFIILIWSGFTEVTYELIIGARTHMDSNNGIFYTCIFYVFPCQRLPQPSLLYQQWDGESESFYSGPSLAFLSGPCVRPGLAWPTLVYHLTSGTSFGLNLQDVHRLISSSVVTNVSSFLTSTAVFNQCPQLFVCAREFCFIFLVLTVFVKSLTLLLKAQRCLFLWLVLVHWSNGASSGSAACIRWLLFFFRRDESLGWCHTSGLLP